MKLCSQLHAVEDIIHKVAPFPNKKVQKYKHIMPYLSHFIIEVCLGDHC